MKKILLIEDNEANQDLITRYLRLYDYDVISATDGKSGLRTAQNLCHEIELVLMDMNLPELDGWEVARRMKSDPATAALPIIALTAHAMVGDREKALSAGCNEYESKPINFSRLFDKIETLLCESLK